MATKILNGLDLTNQKITNLGSPSAAGDATNKSYVDSKINGLRWKESVLVATTAPGTLASDFEDGDTIDGVELTTGDRILIKNQADASENGIYIVAASGAPARAEDADSTDEVQSATVFVHEGTANADTAWTQTEDDVTVDTDDQSWTEFGGQGGASYTFGDGLVETGGDVDIELAANSGLTLSGGVLAVASSIAGDALSFASGVLDVEPGTGLEISSDTIRIAATAAGNGLTGGGGSALAVNTGTASATLLEINSDTVRVAADAAGNGLTGGGGSALAVGAGTGITVNANDVAVNFSIVTRKAAFNVGDNSSTDIDLDISGMSLGSRDYTVKVYRNSSPYDEVLCDVEHTSSSAVRLSFAVAPSTNEYRAVVMG